MKRGRILTAAAGKTRPAIIVQSGHLLPYPMMVVVPVTSEIDARPPPFTRITLDPSPTNGLKKVSQIMVDRIIGLPSAKLRPTPGQLEEDELTDAGHLARARAPPVRRAGDTPAVARDRRPA